MDLLEAGMHQRNENGLTFVTPPANWVCVGFTVFTMSIHEIGFGHYENTPIQVYWQFPHQKLKVFR